MYTRSLLQTPNMTGQHDILFKVATLLDAVKAKGKLTLSGC